MSIAPDIDSHNSGLPKHIAIIMDGNNRWAKQRGLAGVAGHKVGVERIRDAMTACEEIGAEVLTVFAFSSENWRRPENEVSLLMALFMATLKREIDKLHRNNIRLRFIGDRSAFPEKLIIPTLAP